MRKIIVAVCFFCLLSLAGCAPPIQAGTVVGRKFVAAHIEYDMIWIGDTFMACPRDQPECWYIQVRSNDGKRTEWVRITEKAYNKYKEGDHFEREMK